MSTARRLWRLARPKGAVLISLLPLVGLGYGLWERGSSISLRAVAPRLVTLLCSWLCLHAGAMWLNAELDRDEGDVLYGAAASVPRGTWFAGYLALALAPAIASPLGRLTTSCATGCAVMAILYSHPRIALKGQPVGGPTVNGLGYGVLSPLAGWATAQTPATWRGLLVLVLGTSFVLATYFSAQAFQQDEDRARGYRTLVATHGPRTVLGAARGCLAIATVGMTVAAVGGVLPRLALLTVPVWWAADRFLVRWRRLPDGGSGADGARFVSLLAAGILLGVGAAYADHFWAMAHGEPLGGCGTALVPAELALICR